MNSRNERCSVGPSTQSCYIHLKEDIAYPFITVELVAVAQKSERRAEYVVLE